MSRCGFANDPALARAVADLRARHGVASRRDLFRKQKAKSIDRVEAEEYAEFVASLQRQKLENCEEVRGLEKHPRRNRLYNSYRS